MQIETIILALLGSQAAQALVLPNNVGKLPALGWNSWNAFFCDVDATKFMTAANQMVSLGLKQAGYQYVNIDDCWSVKTNRDSSGKLIPDPVKFPQGIKGVADKVHALGLKIGIYSSAGTNTCAGYPASLDHEDTDAQTWASWGIDYLKYDNCYVPSSWSDQYWGCVPDGASPPPNGTCSGSGLAPANYDFKNSKTYERFRRMRDALQKTGRPILYSLCEWGQAKVWTWGAGVGSSWRMSGDITPQWSRILEILNENSFLMNYVDFYAHNDPDMLEVGNGALTYAETRSHFALWAAMKSPLLIGTALDKLSSANLAILKNAYLLAFSQDGTYGKPAMPYKWGTNKNWTFDPKRPAEYWAGKSTQGTLVLMLNTDSSTKSKTAVWGEIPGLSKGGKYQVVDVWANRNMGCFSGQYTASVAAHDTAVLLIKGGC